MLNKQDEFRVLHEPMGDAFYFGPERISNRYSEEVCDKEHAHFAESTFKKVWTDMTQVQEGSSSKRTFSKDMAQYIFNQSSSTQIKSVPSLTPSGVNDNPSLIPTELLLDPSIHHTFLIRHPSKAIPSYERLCFPGSETGFDYFDPEEAGYRELRLLFDFIRSKREEEGGEVPLVIESEELLKDPEGLMGLWCKDSGIDFDKSMLTWNEGTREHFAKWPGFHTSAEQSKGVGQVSSAHQNVKPVKDENLGIVDECIRGCMEDYEHLRRFARGL